MSPGDVIRTKKRPQIKKRKRARALRCRTRIIEGFMNPRRNGAHLKNPASSSLGFFGRITMQMRDRLQWYQAYRVQSTPQGHATFVHDCDNRRGKDQDVLQTAAAREDRKHEGSIPRAW